MKWLIKQIAEITGVSVQTLHHYDKTNVLCPSYRESNGYRLYSEDDLSRLQKVMALKSFGFSLNQIKKILDKDLDSMSSLNFQIDILQDKLDSLSSSIKILKEIKKYHGCDKCIPWKKTLKLIEVYKMSKELENKWAEKILEPDELKKVVSFEASLSESNRQEFKQKWKAHTQEIQKKISENPKSEYGIEMGKKAMELTKILYNGQDAEVRKIVWDKGFKQGNSDLSIEVVEWIDSSIDAYWRHRIYTTLANVDLPNVANQWEDIMQDMCGNSFQMRQSIYQAAETDKNISQKAKDWLKEIFNS